MSYETIHVRQQDSVCFIQLNRPQARNTINRQLLVDCGDALRACEETAHVVVLEGSTDVFCYGADFSALSDSEGGSRRSDAELLYDLWTKLAAGQFISIAHVLGRANAGGLGFVAASDIVLAGEHAQFSLSELLFGLVPACVLPFLVRRVGMARANYLTVTTNVIGVQQAHAWGLVDAYAEDSRSLLRKQLLRLKRVSKSSIRRYREYSQRLDMSLSQCRPLAIATNKAMLEDADNLQGIRRYAQSGLFPWEEVNE